MSSGRLTNTASPDMSSTLEDFIAAGEDAAIISYYNFSILQVEYSPDKTLRIDFTIDNLINDYMDVFKDAAVKVKLTSAEKTKYYYNPDLLAYDIYGSTELDFIIMQMNCIIDPKDFNIPALTLVNKSTLVAIMSRIYSAESKYIQANRDENKIYMPEG